MQRSEVPRRASATVRPMPVPRTDRGSEVRREKESEQTMAGQKIRIRLKSYDHAGLDSSARKIVDAHVSLVPDLGGSDAARRLGSGGLALGAGLRVDALQRRHHRRGLLQQCAA